MMKTELNLQDADGFYEQLLNAHEGLSSEQSEQLNMRLILLLVTSRNVSNLEKQLLNSKASNSWSLTCQ